MSERSAWLTLFISSGFVVMAVIIALKDPPELLMALTTGTFFGLCAVTAIVMLVQQRSMRRSLQTPSTVEVVADAPIPMRKGRQVVAALCLIVVGGIGTVAPMPTLYRVLMAFLVLVGIGLLAAVGLGLHAHRTLRFAPDGLWIELRQVRYRYPWDGLRVVLGQWQGHPTVVLAIDDLEAVFASMEPRPGWSVERARDLLLKRFGNAMAYHGGTEMILAWHYGFDAVRLYEALQRYVTVPAARADLRRALPPPAARTP
ncbi:MAG: hypothetical protein AAF602_01860 [Myxococcota bacterium]